MQMFMAGKLAEVVLKVNGVDCYMLIHSPSPACLRTLFTPSSPSLLGTGTMEGLANDVFVFIFVAVCTLVLTQDTIAPPLGDHLTHGHVLLDAVLFEPEY